MLNMRIVFFKIIVLRWSVYPLNGTADAQLLILQFCPMHLPCPFWPKGLTIFEYNRKYFV